MKLRPDVEKAESSEEEEEPMMSEQEEEGGASDEEEEQGQETRGNKSVVGINRFWNQFINLNVGLFWPVKKESRYTEVALKKRDTWSNWQMILEVVELATHFEIV